MVVSASFLVVFWIFVSKKLKFSLWSRIDEAGFQVSS